MSSAIPRNAAIFSLLCSFALMPSCKDNKSSSSITPAEKNRILETSTENEKTLSQEATAQTTHDEAIPGEVAITEIKFKSSHAVELNDDFTNVDAVKESLNTFKVTTSFSKSLERDVEFVCFNQRLDNGEKSNSTKIIAGEKKGEIVISLLNKELELNVDCKVTSEGKTLAAKSYTFLTSVLIDSEEKFNTNLFLKASAGYAVDRLILLRTGSLITNTESFKLNIEKLYSQDSSIQTFSGSDLLGQRGNLAGKSGGEINVFAMSAVGKLRVNMYGQNGDDQTSVPSAITTRTSPGANAVAETYIQECNSPCAERFLDSTEGERTCHAPARCTTRLSNAGSPATSGQNGAKGTVGYQGNAGGNSGYFNLVTNTEENFDVSFDVRVGSGGDGGAGGIGGPGGVGGSGAGSFPAAPNGANGATGDQGPRGNNGEVSKSCFQNLSTKKIVCSQ